jgi:S1-C subfamily serine protease
MGRFLPAFLTLLFLYIAPALNAFQQDGESFLSLQSRIQEVFNGSRSSVVRVKAAREQRVDSKVQRLLKMGSGFFISKEAHILTTGLLDEPDRIWVEYDNSYFLAEKIGHDPLCNLSLLKLTSKPKDFTFVSFPEPEDDLAVGSILIGITCALEFKIAPTYGIMQSHEFSFGKTPFPTKMIRSNLPLGLGEVGAPVFDLRGRFVGITYAALPDLRSSFLLPASACSRIRDDLLLKGEVDYGWFGITTTRKLNPENGFDILIDDFIEGSPGALSKLRNGDVLRKIAGTVIRNRGNLANASFFARPGTFVEFVVGREGKELIVPVKVASRPSVEKNELTETPKDLNQSENP